MTPHPFPSRLESLLRPFDDFFIPFLQPALPLPPLSFSLTFFTALETSLPLPPVLYLLHLDHLANLSLATLLTLCLLTQIPKSLIFRPRPWMAGRAIPHRRDRTSSFPSRAVVCAVVYTHLALRVMQRPQGIAWILFMATIAGMARINVGAHYPSDAVAGALLGFVVVVVGAVVEEWMNKVSGGGSIVWIVTAVTYWLGGRESWWDKGAEVVGVLGACCAFRWRGIEEWRLEKSPGKAVALAGAIGVVGLMFTGRKLRKKGSRMIAVSLVYWGILIMLWMERIEG